MQLQEESLMNANWGLFVPTYRKENIPILGILDKDKDLTINLCVRTEELDKYAKYKDNDKISIVDLGSGITDIGETRKRIILHCITHHIDYCFQFDDGLTDVYDSKDRSKSISKLFDEIVNIIESDDRKEKIAGFTFTKKNALDANPHKIPDRDFFVCFPAQAYCININFCVKHNINYGKLSEVGFEDASFYGDTIKAEGIWAGRRNIIIEGCIPNQIKNGGNHVGQTLLQLEKKYDECNQRTLQYLNYMMGTSIEKRYREHIGGYLSFVIWDFDYFYEVLVEKRDLNQKIIDRGFSI